MKYIFFIPLFVLFKTTVIYSQTFEIRTKYIAESNFEVQARCTSDPHPTTTDKITGMAFVIKWQNSYDIDLSAPTGDYHIAKGSVEQISGSEEYQDYTAGADPYNLPEEWVLNQWITIASLSISKKTAPSPTLIHRQKVF